MKRNGRLVKRIVTQESVNRYCEWLYGCEKSSGTIKQYKHYLLLFMQYMNGKSVEKRDVICLLYTSPSPRDSTSSRMPSSA